MSKVPMTPLGVKLMREELERLKSVERPIVITAIAEARAHGDLKENAEYHAAREQQGFIEGRVQEIEFRLSHVQVIDVAKIDNSGKVIFGVTVEIENQIDGKSLIYQIVGDDEADIKNNKISISSPISRALIGRYEGDVVNIRVPGGEVEYEIIQVQHL